MKTIVYTIQISSLSYLLSYLIGMKRRTGRHVCAREKYLSFFVMYLSPLTSKVYLLINLFSSPSIVHRSVRRDECVLVGFKFMDPSVYLI